MSPSEKVENWILRWQRPKGGWERRPEASFTQEGEGRVREEQEGEARVGRAGVGEGRGADMEASEEQDFVQEQDFVRCVVLCCGVWNTCVMCVCYANVGFVVYKCCVCVVCKCVVWYTSVRFAVYKCWVFGIQEFCVVFDSCCVVCKCVVCLF